MRNNRLIYAFIFTFIFLGFIGNVNAAGCCYKSNGKYIYDEKISQNQCVINYDSGEMTDGEYICTMQNQICCYNNEIQTWPTTICGNSGTPGRVMTGEQCYQSKTGCCVPNSDGTWTFNGNITSGDACSHSTNGEGVYQNKYECLKKNDSTFKNQNPYEHEPGTTLTPSSTTIGIPNSSNVDPQERTGKDTEWGTGSKSTEETAGNLEVDLGCAGMSEVLKLVKKIYNLIRYATPVVLIILGSVDFMKAVMAGKEDDIAKNKQRFISRLILAVGVFLLLSVFELITNILSRSNVNESTSWYDCWNSLMIMKNI